MMKLTTNYWNETASFHVTSSLATTLQAIDDKEWTVSLILISLLLGGSVYLLTTLSVYEYHITLKKRQTGSLRSEGKCKPADWMRWLCLVGSAFIFLRTIPVLVEISLGQRSFHDFCTVAKKMYSILYSGAMACIYVVLWLRQRLFYQSAQLKRLYSKSVRFFSASVVVIMMVALVFTLSLFLFTRGHTSSPSGCIRAWIMLSATISITLVYIFQLLFQFILLGLFLYPLFKQRTLALSLQADTTKTMHVIKIVAFATFVVIATTGLAGLSILTFLKGRYGPLIDSVYGLDSYVSLLSVIFSFEDWKERLFAFTVQQDDEATRSQNINTSSTTGSTVVLR